MPRFQSLLSVAISACLLTAACSRPVQYTFTGATMGTTYTVKIVLRPDSEAPSGPSAPSQVAREDWLADLSRAIQGELELVNDLMSTWRPDSEISRLNAFGADTPFRVSSPTLEVLTLAREISERSGGAFDITVGPLVNAWGFGAEKSDAAEIAPDRLAELRERVGWRNLRIDAASSTVVKTRNDVYCDLAAIAKGYGVDRVAGVVEAHGATDYMVEIGGEVRTSGANLSGGSWRIGVENPDSQDEAKSGRVLLLHDAGVATSGDYRNFYFENGRRISHTIDPRTGRPIEHGLASVTVVHPRCAAADAWATALMVLGPDEGMAVAQREGLTVHMIVRAAEGGFAERMTPDFEGRLRR